MSRAPRSPSHPLLPIPPGEGSMPTPGDGDAESAAGVGSTPAPVPRAPPTLPPFLSKCYDMVDDPSTDSAVSWGPDGGSFVIWDPHAFSKDLLPKYFKHSNLSSFVRQLNTYGFHKVDPDRWEFANEGFLKGQKQLLKSIMRKKNSQAVSQLKPVVQEKHSSVKACVEVGKFGLEEEVERLKRDKNVLMQELVKLRQHQQNTDDELRTVRERLQVMEQHQQQMVSFLGMAVQSPGFFDKMVQQNVKTRWRTEVNKKRRLPALEQGSNSMSIPSSTPEGQIVKYQPLPPKNWTSSSLTPISATEITPGKDPLSDGISGLNISADDKASALQSYTLTEDDIFPDIPDDYLEQLLGSPLVENGQNIDQGDLDFSVAQMDFDFSELETQLGTSES